MFKNLHKSNKKNIKELRNKSAVDKTKARAEKMKILKFVLFSASAGIIQLASNALLLIFINQSFAFKTCLAYIISLILSVLWNFTFNRMFTSKSASNVPKAMLLTFGFYLLLAPGSTFLQAWLVDGNVLGLTSFECLGLDPLVGTIVCMILYFVLEFLYQRFVVFKDSIDSNKNIKK